MLLVNDLNLKESIIPLFNYTISKQASALLLKKFEQLPETEEQVYQRQAILKGLLANWHVLNSFAYQPLAFKEVYHFFEELADNRIRLSDHPFKTALRFYISEKEKYKTRSQLVQVVLFLVRMQRLYFSRVDFASLPENFRGKLKQAMSFLKKLDLETFDKLIRDDQFSVRQIVALSGKLNNLTSNEIQAFWKFFIEFEVYLSIAKGIQEHKLEFATFSKNSFSIEGFYHPAIKNPVRNSIELTNREHVVLLTGPNMSGKSTLLRSVGICVYLAHVGVGVPAVKCITPFYNSILIAINLNDNLQQGYSHFMNEISNLKTVLEETGNNKRCFAVFDEIFRGTNLDDAIQITRTTVNGLGSYKKSTFFISTHLLQLENELDNTDSYIRKLYIDCSLKDGHPQFTYSLKEGWSQLKIGQFLFDKAGLTAMLTV